MDSWDDDEFEVPDLAAVQTKVAASWDDEEEEEEEVAPQPTNASAENVPKGPLKPKQLKKLKMKEIEEKRQMEIALTKARLAQQANETAEERKAREKASMEEADLEAALDAFAPTQKKDDAAAASGDVESAIGGMRLLSLADHEKLGELVSNRLITSNAKYALECMKVIITRGSVNLTADDMKDLTTIINVIKNEKIAAAKPKGKKKKQTGRQGYANVERDLGEMDEFGGGAGAGRGYDDYDDFM
ncbi:hypothetical protein P43SY_004259 [Pythium insidiosum]|uniref:Eukaryotic translation initiation factor 3 subunit J n=1 Tax=Pythium insidiosum TaxID=114742 RepID=A0AAD5LCK0_PYTIN|nr:hypothetical protein P43SY_004259 [Pythium insidiosum]